eukprot:Hpha_TRINITY_DN1251_c0_g1::TRINITY_DN1251_c0_g1_i1::g.44738::m.44738
MMRPSTAPRSGPRRSSQGAVAGFSARSGPSGPSPSRGSGPRARQGVADLPGMRGHSAASPARSPRRATRGLLDWQTDGSLNLVGKFPLSAQVLAIEVVGSHVWTADQDGVVKIRQMNGIEEAEIPKDPQHGKVFAVYWHQVLVSKRVCEEA